MAFSAENQVERLLISSWTLLVLSGIFLGLRVYCKLKGSRMLWWDDHVLIASWISVVISVILTTVTIPYGLGSHMADVPFQNYAIIGLLSNVNGTFAILASVWSKTAFAITLLRLMTESKWARGFLWFVIVTINIFMGLVALFQWVRCSPVSKSWDFLVEGTCWEPEIQVSFAMFASAWSAATDILLSFLPWKLVWNLQMKTKEKIGVAVAMSMGVLAGATSIMKLVRLPTLASPDFTYNISDLILWGKAEAAVTIMAVCIPVLRVLFQEVKSKRRYYGGRTGSQFGSAGQSLHSKNVVVTTTVKSSTHARPSNNDSTEEIIMHDINIQGGNGTGRV